MKPDGTFSKLMNNKRIKKLGWKNEISLENGLKQAYAEFEKTFKYIEFYFSL